MSAPDIQLIATAPPHLIEAAAAEAESLLPLAETLGLNGRKPTLNWRDHMPASLASLDAWVHETIGPTRLRWGKRLAKMAVGRSIGPHVDAPGGPLPDFIGPCLATLSIQSDPGVQFQCGATVVKMRPGELWLWDRKALHSAANNSARDRIYLVYDVFSLPGGVGGIRCLT